LTKTNYIVFHSPTQVNSSFNVTINSHPISKVSEVCILGVIIDQDLNFKSHIQHIKKKLSSSLFIFTKIRFKIPLTIAWYLYHSIFKSHLIYCLLIWGSSCISHLQPINILHNKFLKTLLFLPRRTPTALVYSQACVLSLSNLYSYFCAMLIYKFINLPQLIPNTLTTTFTTLLSTLSHLTRARNSHNLFNPSCSTTTRHNHIAIQGPIIWGSIPKEIKSAQSITVFKNLLSAHLIKQFPD
jgi:hypothetical protein